MTQIETFQILGCGGIAYQSLWVLRNLIVNYWGLASPERLDPSLTREISTIDGETYEEHNFSRQGFGLGVPLGTGKAVAFLDFLQGELSDKILHGRAYFHRIEASGFAGVDYPSILCETQRGLTLLMCCPDNNQCRLDTWAHLRKTPDYANPCIVLMAGCERDFGQVTLGFNLGGPDYHDPFALTPSVVANQGDHAACGDQTVQANICTAYLLMDAVGWVLANLDDILSPKRPKGYLFPNWFWSGSPMKSWVQKLTQTKGDT